MVMITTSFVINIINYDCNYILNNHDYNNEYSVNHTNTNVILHFYSLSYICYTDITTK